MTAGSDRVTVNLTRETWERLQQIATPFQHSERGTPDKVIAHLLDVVDELDAEELTAPARKPHVRVDQAEILEALSETGGGDLPTIAEHFGISTASARRKADGLVAQGKLHRRAGSWYEPAAGAGDVPIDADRPPGTSGSWGEA